MTQGEAGAQNAALSETAIRLRDALARFIALVEPLSVELWNRSGLTMGQLRLVFALRSSPGLSTGEVGALLGVTGSSLTGLVDRVEALGFVERAVDTQDRRVTRLRLSEQGVRLMDELEAERHGKLDGILGHLTPERRVLLVELFQEFVIAAEEELLARPFLSEKRAERLRD